MLLHIKMCNATLKNDALEIGKQYLKKEIYWGQLKKIEQLMSY